MKVQKLPRVFKFKIDGKDTEVKDPNPNLSPDEVTEMLSGQYPELTNCTVKPAKIIDDIAVYEINTVVGTKG